VYELASEGVGACEVVQGSEKKPDRDAIRYDGQDLVFSLVFFRLEAAGRFSNRVLGMRDIDRSNIDVGRPVRKTVMHYEIVHAVDYHTDDEEDSPKWSVAPSSARTEVDPRSD